MLFAQDKQIRNRIYFPYSAEVARIVKKHNARIKSKQSASCRQFAVCNRVSGCRLGSYVTKSGVLPPRRKEGIELPMHRAAES